jgi:L-2-hydroxyglutarate oxidase LhgO
MPTADFLVIGGGVIGLRTAIEAKRRHPDCRVILLEKEKRCGLHASGRNSGVLHAGFYYAADSFKARFTSNGNHRLSDYCEARGLRINRCGKLVVARDDAELEVLDELLRRACTNGVELQRITAEEARRIEPRVRTHERALFSPDTTTVDPVEVVTAFAREAEEAGVEVRTGVTYRGVRGGEVLTGEGKIDAGFVVNAGGLYADRVARDFGFGGRYRILPFKGLYLRAEPGAPPLNTNIYPVPDLATPFLGVHFTVTVDGGVTIGPTAVPAFWREQYRWLDGFNLREFLEVSRLEGFMFLGNRAQFRSVALRELPKYQKRTMIGRAAKLCEGVQREHFRRWGPAGIRAQLVDVERYELVNDFTVEGDDRSFHVLNAVSPAFTCAIPFAEFVMDEIDARVG